MVKKKYIPQRGDIVWVDFNPRRGREQAKKRPAIVLSPAIYNERTHLMIACPITSHVKGYPFEVEVNTSKIVGAVLCDHVRSLDWHVRGVSFVQKAPMGVIADVQEKITILING